MNAFSAIDGLLQSLLGGTAAEAGLLAVPTPQTPPAEFAPMLAAALQEGLIPEQPQDLSTEPVEPSPAEAMPETDGWPPLNAGFEIRVATDEPPLAPTEVLPAEGAEIPTASLSLDPPSVDALVSPADAVSPQAVQTDPPPAPPAVDFALRSADQPLQAAAATRPQAPVPVTPVPIDAALPRTGDPTITPGPEPAAAVDPIPGRTETAAPSANDAAVVDILSRNLPGLRWLQVSAPRPEVAAPSRAAAELGRRSLIRLEETAQSGPVARTATVTDPAALVAATATAPTNSGLPARAVADTPGPSAPTVQPDLPEAPLNPVPTPVIAAAPAPIAGTPVPSLHAEILGQVAETLTATAKDALLSSAGRSQATVHIDPPRFGEVKVDVRLDSDDRVHVTIHALEEATKDFLDAEIDDILDSLIGQRLDVVELSVKGDASPRSSFDRAAQDPQFHAPDRGRREREERADEQERSPYRRPSRPRDGGVDTQA